MSFTVLEQTMYTREEAAEMLGVSLRTLDRMRYAGTIEAVRISPHKICFAEETLRAHVHGQKQASEAS